MRRQRRAAVRRPRHPGAVGGLHRRAQPEVDQHRHGPVAGGRHQLPRRNAKGTSPSTKVIIGSCNGQQNQQWTVQADGTITGNQPGLCLDATGAGTADGTPLELWTCNGGGNQKWTLR